MKKLNSIVVASLLGLAFAATAATQEMPAIPKILQINREFVKPGKGGPAHEKTESAFIKAMSEAKWPTYYIALSSMSGKTRVLFLTPYASFEAWQKDADSVTKNDALSSALDQAIAADGELLDSMDQAVLLMREEMSLRPHPDLSQFRYLEISGYHVKPGHTKDWTELVGMVKAAYEKAVPDAHWGMFQLMYGGAGDTYLVFTGHKSMSEIDQGIMQNKLFTEAMGESGMRVFTELIARSVNSSEHQLFAINPQMSYVPDSWKKADPDFWTPEAMPETMKPVKEKKAKH